MNYTTFLDSFFEQINECSLDVSGLKLDHLAYQASSAANYEELLTEFSNFSELVSEKIIGERRVAIFKLQKPIQYKQYSINALELIEPKLGHSPKSELQHAEFVANQKFEKYLENYPNIPWDTSSMNREEFSHLKLNFKNGLTLKFSKQAILELVSAESKNKKQ